MSGLNKRCQRCEGATNSQIKRSGQNKMFCPLLASGMLSLTTTRALTPELRLDAKTTLHCNSFGLLKMCPCTLYMGAHLTLSKTPFTPTGGSGKPCMGETPLPILSICKPIQQKCASRLGQRFGEKVTQFRGCALFCDPYRPHCHCFPRLVVTNTCMLFLQS